jgi:hypothetical protein
MVVLLALLLAGCATTTPRPAVGNAQADKGYFLSLRQKGQLIAKGRIKDSFGNEYDVWIVPGYVVPAQRMVKYLGRTGDCFAEYAEREKYQDIRRHGGDALEWGYDDCMRKFVFRGVPRAWGKYFRRAGERSEKRVFGWWFSYPWALMEGTVDTVVRVPLGLTGMVLGTTAGVVIVPGFYAVNSTVEGVGNFAGGVVVGPVVADAWNTIIAPPMSLVGQKPSPARVDGYWVTLVTKEELDSVSRRSTPAAPEEIAALANWGRVLLAASQALDPRRSQVEKDRNDDYKAVEERYRASRKALQEEEQVRVTAAADAPAVRAALETLRQRGFDRDRIPAAHGEIDKILREIGVPPHEIGRVHQLLSQYPPSDAFSPPPAAVRQKTDPLQESLQVIKQVSTP